MQPVDLQSGTSAPSGRLLSHSSEPSVQEAELLQAMRSRLLRDQTITPTQLDALLCLVDALATFELGRFLLRHLGMNAYWAHQNVTCQPGTLTRDATPMLQHALFERIPLLVATRQRLGIDRLRPGGTRVTSFLTPSPQHSAQSPWRLDKFDAATLHLHEQLFTKVTPPRLVFRTQARTLELLQSAGYADVRFIEDPFAIFPAIIACKPVAA